MARTKYGYAETTDLRATVAGPIRSVVNTDMALENGMLMKIGALTAGSNEVYEAALPTAKDKVVLIHSALYAYDTSSTLGQHEMYLRKEAGEPARAFYLYEGDRNSWADYTIKPLADKVVVGNRVVVDTATGFLTEIAAEDEIAGYGFVGEIETIEYKSNLTMVCIRVIKNETVA